MTTSEFQLFDPASDIPGFRAPRNRALLDYWLSLRGHRRMPCRADLDPSAIPSLLPHLMLTELSGEPPRARYRLVGTEIVALAKFDFTGRFADELQFQDAEAFDYAGCYAAVAASGLPGRGLSWWLVAGQRARWIEFLICPLSDDDQRVNQCIALEDYEPLDLVERDSLVPVARR